MKPCPVRLLITARDVAAALHLIEIARTAATEPRFIVTIVAQAPATHYLQRTELAIEEVRLPPVRRLDGAAATELLAAARDVIERVRPDAVLCGLSTPVDGGIDEAVLAQFEGPSFVMQDFWGEANTFFGKAAQLYLALDEEAVRLSKERHGLPAIVVGSPRHSAYGKLDIPRLRRDIRATLKMPAGARVFGFFGQGLHALPGYRRTLEAWTAAVRHQPSPQIAVYRPHPRESTEQRDWTIGILRSAGIDSVVMDKVDVEHALLACDVVCSAFSNCTYDVAYLNRFSDRPIITPVSLFFDPDITDYFHRMVHLPEFPYLRAGLVMAIETSGDLPERLAAAATPQEKRRRWLAARNLADPSDAAQKVLDTILDHVGRARTGAASGHRLESP